MDPTQQVFAVLIILAISLLCYRKGRGGGYLKGIKDTLPKAYHMGYEAGVRRVLKALGEEVEKAVADRAASEDKDAIKANNSNSTN